MPGSLEPFAGATPPTGPLLIGRDRELQVLRTGLQGALAGRGGLFLITGEPGIGKTRLATVLGQEAGRDAWVLWGRCWEGGGAPAYWPWVQVLRAYERTQTAHGGGVRLDPASTGLAPLVTGDTPAGSAGEPAALEFDDTRFRLFDAVTLFLTGAAQHQPLLLVLDDLHAADSSSLLLLQFLARELHGARILVLGTCREAEVRRSPNLSRLLGGLGRESQSLQLRGLTTEDVGQVIDRTVSQTVSPRVKQLVRETTGGNPFFVDEVLRLLSARDDWQTLAGHDGLALPVPESVRDTVRRRLEPLRPEIRRLLLLASVIGREFDLPVLERVAGASLTVLPPPADSDGLGEPTPQQLIGLLGEAVAAGILDEATDSLGRYGFVHALIREALRHELPPAQRVRLHKVVAEVLENRNGGSAPPNPAELAHHYFQAAAAGGAEKATHYAQAAGDQAMAILAFEEAAHHYARALDSLKFGAADEPLSCELLLRLGEAQRRGLTGADSGETFQRAAAIARRLEAPAQLARAALGFARAESGVVNDALVALLSEALERLEPVDGIWRARVLGRLAMALYFTPAAERRLALSTEAVEMALRLGDPSTIVATLVARHFAIWGPDTIDERLRVANEVVRRSEALDEVDLAAEGRLWRMVDLLEVGDVPGFLDAYSAITRTTTAGRLPRYRWNGELLRAMRALSDGRLDEAEQAAQAALARGQEAQVARAEQFFGVQMFFVRRRQGRLAELEPVVRSFAEQFDALPIWRCGLALLYCVLGRLSEAEPLFARMAVADFADLPRDGNWLPAIVLLTEVCVALGDRLRAAQLYELLAPHAARNAIIAEAVAYLGPVSHSLGLLAALLGRTEEAAAHFAAARLMTTRLGATLNLADTQRAEAEMLQRREAAPVASPPVSRGEAADEGVWRREGDFWTVAFAGVELRLKDGRGPFYLGHLLRHPGEELAATELVAAAQGGFEPAATGARASARALDLHEDDGVAAPLLDAKAKAAYQRRLRELQEELEEAEEFNDLGRVERAREEIDQLSQHLSAALGLGGRDRTSPSTAERARIAVTKAIVLVFKSLERDHPALRDYLRRTIRTGRFCSFTPDPRQPVRWSL